MLLRLVLFFLILNHSLFAQNSIKGMVHPVVDYIGCDTIGLLPSDNIEKLSGLFCAFVASGDEKYLFSCRDLAAEVADKASDYSGEIALADLFLLRCDLSISGKKYLIRKYCNGEINALLDYSRDIRSISDTSRFIDSFITIVQQSTLPGFLRDTDTIDKVFDDWREIHNNSTQVFQFEVAHLAVRFGVLLERYEDVVFYGDWMISNYPMNFETQLILANSLSSNKLINWSGIDLKELVSVSSLCEVQKQHLLSRID